MKFTPEMIAAAEREYWRTDSDPEGARDMGAALNAALSASPAPAVPVEPVAWRVRDKSWSETYWHYFTKEPRTREDGEIWEPLYATPPAPAAGDVTDEMVEAALAAYLGFDPPLSYQDNREDMRYALNAVRPLLAASPATDLREENERQGECDHPFLAEFDKAADCIAAGKCICGKDRGEVTPAFAFSEKELLQVAEYLGCDADSHSIIEVIGDKVREGERLKNALAEQAKMMAIQFEAYMEQKARAADAEALLEKAREALKPFADVADGWVDEHGWTDMACQNERIVDWFGPSDFRRARATLQELEGRDNG